MARKSHDSIRTEDVWDGEVLDEVAGFHEQKQSQLEAKAWKSGRNNGDLEMSDEEVLAMSNEEESEDSEGERWGLEQEEGESKQNQDEDWGKSRKNYYGADEAGNEDEAKEEEAEALRLQKSHLSGMSASDFFGDDDLNEWKEAAATADLADTESLVNGLPDQDLTNLSRSEKLKLLDLAYPEAIPLAEELENAKSTLISLNSRYEGVHVPESSQVQIVALTIYIAALSSYFSLLIERTLNKKGSLKDHSIMAGILKAKELWRSAEELVEPSTYNNHSEGDEIVDIKFASDSHVSEDNYLSDSDESDRQIMSQNKRKRATADQELEQSSDEEFRINLPTVNSFVKKPKKTISKSKISDFGENEDIDVMDREEKANRKRGLKFYTSKIDQQSSKSRAKYTGDEDLPYRERAFERQQRIAQENAKRNQNNLPDDVDDFGSDDNAQDGHDAKNVRDSFDNEYYDLVSATSKNKKLQRKEAHTLATKAAKEGVLKEMKEHVGEDGKRAINYQILKNKGLTAHRKKENRNARVKKRKKYETAQKKLKSFKRVATPQSSSYGGELTGIKKNIARSVRFQ